MVDLQEKSIELWRDEAWKLHAELRKMEDKVAGLIHLAAQHMDEENKALARIVMLEQALDDALGEWEYNATTYKSDPLIKKHADLEQIAHYRKLLNDRLK